MFAGETCLAKYLNVSPKLRPQVTKKQTSWKKKKKNFRYLINLKKSRDSSMAFFLLCEITDTVTPWSSKMFVFSRPLIISTGKRSFQNLDRRVTCWRKPNPQKKKQQTNKQTNTQSVKKKAKDTYTCGQELTRINASEKENKYTGSKEKYSS